MTKSAKQDTTKAPAAPAATESAATQGETATETTGAETAAEPEEAGKAAAVAGIQTIRDCIPRRVGDEHDGRDGRHGSGQRKGQGDP